MGCGHLRRSGCTPSRIRPSVRIGTPSDGGRLLGVFPTSLAFPYALKDLIRFGEGAPEGGG